MARHAKHFERAIENLKKIILSMGTAVEENVQKSVTALLNRDSSLGLNVIDSDEDINVLEVDIEEECLKMLALYQPVANDLRMIISILKINNDLERIGDLAVNIAERAVFLATQGSIEVPVGFNEISKKAQWMLRKSLDALVDHDVHLARTVCVADDEVDEINRMMFSEIGHRMQKEPEKLDPYMHLLSACRYLERVADHATNVAEDVIYMVEGRIIRHNKEVIQSEHNDESSSS